MYLNILSQIKSASDAPTSTVSCGINESTFLLFLHISHLCSVVEAKFHFCNALLKYIYKRFAQHQQHLSRHPQKTCFRRLSLVSFKPISQATGTMSSLTTQRIASLRTVGTDGWIGNRDACREEFGAHRKFNNSKWVSRRTRRKRHRQRWPKCSYVCEDFGCLNTRRQATLIRFYCDFG